MKTFLKHSALTQSPKPLRYVTNQRSFSFDRCPANRVSPQLGMLFKGTAVDSIVPANGEHRIRKAHIGKMNTCITRSHSKTHVTVDRGCLVFSHKFLIWLLVELKVVILLLTFCFNWCNSWERLSTCISKVAYVTVTQNYKFFIIVYTEINKFSPLDNFLELIYQ